MERQDEQERTDSGPRDFILDDLDLPSQAAAQDRPPSDDDASKPQGRGIDQLHDEGENQPHRRRRHRRAGNIPVWQRPVFMRATDPILRWGPFALLAFAPLAKGSVEAWSEMVVVAGCAAIGAVWLLRLIFFPDRCAADRSAGGHIGSWSAGLHSPMITVLGVGVLQLLPLGHLVTAVSPIGAEIQRQAGLNTGSLTLTMLREETLRALAQYSGFALLFFAILDGLHGRKEVRRLAMGFLILGFAQALGGILWHYQGAGRVYWDPTIRENPFGPYINRNHFACLMGMTVPFGVGFLLSIGQTRRGAGDVHGHPAEIAAPAPSAEKGPKRLIVGFAVAVMAGALGLSLSRGGLVSTFAALSALAAALGARRLTRGHLWMAASAVAAAFAFTLWLVAQPLFSRLGSIGDPSSMASRTWLWADTLQLAADFPLFGAGFGTFAEIYPRYQTAMAAFRVEHAHNDWVQLVAEGGLAGTLAVIALLGKYAAAAWKLLDRRRDRQVIFLALGGLAGLLAFLLHSFAEFNSHIPANALWFTVLAALTLKAISSRMVTDP